MNMTKIVVCGLMAVPMLAEAMPSKADLDKVSPVVADLMKPEQDALKAGKKTKSEVADAALELVKQADGEAAKLLLAKGAFNLYVRDGQFDKALDTLKVMRTEVPDLTPQYLTNIIETSLKRVPKKNGGQLYQLLDETKTLARYQDELKKMEAQAKKRPADKALQTKLAEHYAVLGDWTKALEAFAKGEDAKAAQMAKDEQDGAKDAKAIADFWWGYPDKKGEEFEKSFKQHAATLYSQAVASGKLVGLNKVQCERRIEEAKIFGDAVYEAQAEAKDGLYCVIDLSGGPNATKYPVSYLNDVPKGGWTDEYRTTKLVLRKIPAGQDPLGRYTISKDFYIGIFEVTQKQWELVMGSNPARNKGDVLPVETVSWADIRGSSVAKVDGGLYEVGVNSFAGKLTHNTGMKGFDLPTEAQWEYATRSGTKGNCYFGERSLGEYGWYGKNSGGSTHSVGCKKPNDWGLYDVYGNVWERCLDCVTIDMLHGSDPIGVVNGKMCGNRGGQSGDPDRSCSSVARAGTNLCNAHGDRGFRLAIQPPFEPPKSGDAKVPVAVAGSEVAAVKTAEENGAAWRYSFGVSNGGWMKPEFDDRSWKEGKGMFADGSLVEDRRFTRIAKGKRTTWDSDQIWLRQSFSFDGKSRQNIEKVILRYFACADIKIYLNGEQIPISADGGNVHQNYDRGYVELDITEKAKKLLKLGKGNVLALHASNNSDHNRTYWIRYVDAGLSITTK